MFYHALTGNGGTTPTEDLEPVLLWTNPSPNSNFAAQTVSLNLTDYSGVIIEFNKADTSQILTTRVYAKKTDNFSIFGCGYIADTGIARNILAVNNTGVQFGAVNTATAVCIPYKIYGVKKYVVEPVNNLQYITSLEGKTISFNAEDNATYLVIESAYNASGAVSIRECSVDNGELEVLKHAVQSKLETYTALIKNAVGTVNYNSAATSDGAMILIFKLVG